MLAGEALHVGGGRIDEMIDEADALCEGEDAVVELDHLNLIARFQRADEAYRRLLRQFELFRPAQSETVRDFYAELPINVKVTGNYHDMGACASDIGQLPRIVTLNDINLNVGKDGTLTMDTIAKTFRYLDDEEVATQRAAAKAAKAAKK